MSLDPTLGLHRLRNACQQRSRIGEHSRVLARGLDVAIAATRCAVPRRARRDKDFRIDVGLHVARKPLEAMAAKSEERRIEQQLYLAYGPASRLGSKPFWGQLVAYQVPLFDSGARDGWGHIDLLALDAAGLPIVIELKKQSSTEPPLRAAVEGLANAIAVEECWPAMSEEIRAMCRLRGLGQPVADAAAPVQVIVLAPAGYWDGWQPSGKLGRAVNSTARLEFRKLTSAFEAAGHPIALAAFDWPFTVDPRVRIAEVDW
jgi:hypothetical protein